MIYIHLIFYLRMEVGITLQYVISYKLENDKYQEKRINVCEKAPYIVRRRHCVLWSIFYT